MEIPEDNIQTIELTDISNKLFGEKIKIRGMITKITEMLNEQYQTMYYCDSCNTSFKVKGAKKPWKCFNSNCQAQGSMRKTEELYRDFREMEIEELIDNLDRQPERIRVRLMGNILDRFDIKNLQIGQMVEIIAVVDKEKTKVKNDRVIYSYYLMCSVINILDYSVNVEEPSNEDIEKMNEIRKNPLEILKNTLAPNIVGLDSIKKAIILQMVRGPEDLRNVRPRIHILVIGSPSTGKSQLAWESHQKTPKSIFGSGDNMSAAGLTASVEKDELTGRFIARGGLLSRASKSLVFIDEVDKLRSDDKKALHTPMEQGIIVVDKAGMHIQLSADCSILACCNPKNGNFDFSGYTAITKEVGLPEPIISRFDLIYYVQDDINSEKDEKIIESLFTSKENCMVDADIFKKYISKASKINPIITNEIKNTLKDIYKKLRESSKNSLEKITSRQAGGLLRLAVAHAKIRMSEIVELEDLKVAEEIILDSLQSIGFERRLNSLDQASLYTNTTNKKINVQNQLIELIKDLVISGKDEKEIEDIILARGFAIDLFKRTFEGLKREGSIIGTRDLKWVN